MDKNVHKETHYKVDQEENIASKEVQNLNEICVVVFGWRKRQDD
jgi:hypothetical protein